MTESTEMYLLTIALLRETGQPVPISRLAEELAISPVSTNQMCRRLAEQGLMEYLPYKGVTLTSLGDSQAQRVLRRRRLWEVFLVDRLQLDLSLAAEAACGLEHVTTDEIADRLSAFLGQPAVCPHNEPIPPGSGASRLTATSALTETVAVEPPHGAQGHARHGTAHPSGG